MADEVTVDADAAYLRSVAEYIERDGSDEGVADAHNLRSIADRIDRTTTAVPNSVVEAMIQAFLQWQLPEHFNPDAGISFEPLPSPHSWPTGTNLLHYDQAREMVEHMLSATTLQQSAPAALTAAKQDSDAELHPVMADIMAEVEKATRKFPTWPTRIIDAGNVVSEEAGELAKACLQVTYEKDKETLEGVRMEAIQTAAMAFRFLCSMHRYDTSPAEQHEQNPLDLSGETA